MNEDEIKVSICCLVYNHEKYLRKCLEGFVNQKTNFKYEVLIHDDASTDSSVDIIHEYEEKYPSLFKPIYQKDNQYSKGVKISWTYQFPRVKGKYIAFCEGDDYWCDENKLQMQYDEMERNSDASICVHRVEHILENGKHTGTYCHGLLESDCHLSSQQFFNVMQKVGDYPFQTSSYFLRSVYLQEILNNKPQFFDVANVGDVPIMLFYALKGKYIYLNKVMSCYRMESVGSWNSSINSNEKRITQNKTAIAAFLLFDIYSKGIYSEFIDIIVRRYFYKIYQMSSNYQQICFGQYKHLLRKESLKQRLFYYVMAIFPAAERLYVIIKRKKYEK